IPSAIITGANSGIGHAFAQIIKEEGFHAFLATDLTIGDKLKGPACDTAQLAVPSQASIQAFKHGFKDHPLGLLLNIVTGAMSPKEQDSLETVDEKVLTNTFSVNTFEGRLSTLLTQTLLPNLLKSNRPRIGVMSSRVGSIGDNSTGGSYAYRALKAALNSIFKGMAMD
ncbi:uncharacterized protein K441DRAFT_574584, partial [Cenococcum geophilum 1.58]|uniref:uncharacterized protein n=1 Tax=Cenococcum geophilum 1.58 TaxID=794803 RepID=UPI00358F1501